MPVYDVPLLSQFLRTAVLTGVESSVRIHIDRGDDLNMRDGEGRTPLMLAAGRNRATICRLLIDAGVNPDLLDLLGKNALNIALDAGAFDAAAVIAARVSTVVPSEASVSPDDDVAIFKEDMPNASSEMPSNEVAIVDKVKPLGDFRFENATGMPMLFPVDGPSEFANEEDPIGLTGWEAEEVKQPPAGDFALFEAASQIQSAISEHEPTDTSADWDGFDVLLPERATPLPRANDAEARERLRLVLLRAIREGSVPAALITDLARGEEGEPDSEAVALLSMVINDLGSETDERFEYQSSHESFEVFIAPEEKPDEEDAINEAVAFLDEWAARRNEPMRIYQRELQGEALLTGAAEVALGQAMERGVEKALDALAAWPSGIDAVLDAVNKVSSGAKPLRWLTSGPSGELHDADAISSAVLDAEGGLATDASNAEDDDSQFGLDANESISELQELRIKAGLLSGLAVGASQDAPEYGASRGALASLGLTRSFLMELADSKLSREPEFAFGQAMKAYRRARDKMTVANLKLVYSIAKKYLFSGQPLDDLLQEGNIGLVKAVDRYDWRRGFKFSTYATWWIRQQVGRYVADKGKTIRLPVHVYETTQRIAQAARAFELRHGHPPTVEEVADLVGSPIKKVLALKRLAMEPLPLHEIDALDDHIAADAKDEYTARDPMDIIEDMQLTGAIDRFLATLKPKEARVLRMRFGIGIGAQESMTLDEIGKRLDVTRERIRQIEGAALRKLKHPARLEQLLRELNGAPPQRGKNEEPSVNSGDEDEDEHDTLAVAGDTPPQLKPAQAIPRPERPNASTPSALENLLSHARAIGIAVEDYPEGRDRRIWVHITETPDNHSRKIVRKLIEHGFIFWPGRGYWR